MGAHSGRRCGGGGRAHGEQECQASMQTHEHALTNTHPLINHTHTQVKQCNGRSKRHEADRIRPVSEPADYSASYF